jgi:ATP-binding cassette subfamily C protein CydD
MGKARALVLLDGLAAIGFAAGLAFAIDAIASGRRPLILSLCLLVVVVSGLFRGLLARLAGEAGARASAEAKAGIRADLARAVFPVAQRARRPPPWSRGSRRWTAISRASCPPACPPPSCRW